MTLSTLPPTRCFQRGDARHVIFTCPGQQSLISQHQSMSLNHVLFIIN